MYQWAILGQGVIASQMAEALNKEGHPIYAVAGRHKEKVEAFAQTYGILHAYTIEEMLADEQVDIVYIATPHDSHHTYIMQALQKGKHVLCEKAITVNKQQLEEAIALAEEKRLILMEAMTIFHMPLYQKLRQLLAEGSLGRIKMVQASFGSLKEYDVTNRFFNKELAGGALLDIGTYAMSAIRLFLSAQPSVVQTDWIPFESGVDEMSGTVLKNKEGEMATMTLAMRSKLPKKIVVAAEKGYIEIENYPRADSARIVMSRDGSEQRIQEGDSREALRYEIRDMEEAVRTTHNDTLSLSRDVTALLWEIRSRWGMYYPFEEK